MYTEADKGIMVFYLMNMSATTGKFFSDATFVEGSSKYCSISLYRVLPYTFHFQVSCRLYFIKFYKIQNTFKKYLKFK